MNLTSQERSAILAHEFPDIIRPFVQGEACPFEPAEQIVLKALRSAQGPVPQVSITITGRHRGKKGEWIAEYSLRDDRPLYLRAGSGYTRSAADSIDPEASVEEEKTLKEYAASARLSHSKVDEVRRKRQNDAARSALTEALSGLHGAARETFLTELQVLCRQAKLQRVA